MPIGPLRALVRARPAVSNLLLKTEIFSNVAWTAANTTVTDDTTVAPDGATSADTLTTSNTAHSLRQNATVVALTEYTFSFYALRGTMTDLKYSIYNNTGAADIVAATSYYAQTNSSTFTRISVVFTTPVGCTSIRVYPIRDSGATGTVFVWGAQLVAGTEALPYSAVA